MVPQTLPEARAQIDALDEQIQKLISRRARIAQAVAHIKLKMGDTGNHYRPSREAEVLRQAMERNHGPDGGPLTDETIARLMREIMSVCLSLESPLRSEEHTSELQSLMRISYAVFCLKKKKKTKLQHKNHE